MKFTKDGTTLALYKDNMRALALRKGLKVAQKETIACSNDLLIWRREKRA
jgi:hypothetical protein